MDVVKRVSRRKSHQVLAGLATKRRSTRKSIIAIAKEQAVIKAQKRLEEKKKQRGDNGS